MNKKQKKLFDKHFDKKYYLSHYKEAVDESGLTPEEHYLQKGWILGYNPNDSFNTNTYLVVNKTAVKNGDNPFVHWLNKTKAADLKKPYKPTSNDQEDALFAYRLMQEKFDDAYYLQEYPEIGKKGLAPLAHFYHYGWKEGKNPTKNFDTEFYLKTHEDVAKGDVNPFFHYLAQGKNEGRKCFPDIAPAVTRAPTAADAPLEEEVKRRSQEEERVAQFEMVKDHVNAEYYYTENPDVKNSEINAAYHYFHIGWREGRNPSPFFDNNYYLNANDDVRAAGMNPFFHYIASGEKEGRRGMPPGGRKTQIINRSHTMEQLVHEYSNHHKKDYVNIEIARVWFNQFIKKEIDELIVSFTHDSYLEQVGGIQICVEDEVNLALKDKNQLYINLYPAVPLPCLDHHVDYQEKYIYNVNINNKTMKRIRGIDIITILKEYGAANSKDKKAKSKTAFTKPVKSKFIMHSLLGHNVNMLIEMHKTLKVSKTIFWLHDYFSLCVKYNLLRNNVTYCNAPKIESGACSVCIFGKERDMHSKKMAKLFVVTMPHVVSPSEFTLNLWKEKANLKHSSSSVVAHCHLKPSKDKKLAQVKLPTAKKSKSKKDDSLLEKPLKTVNVAYLGHPSYHKGTDSFRELLQGVHGDKRYDFFHLGKSKIFTDRVKYINTEVRTNERNIMIKNLRENNIHVVFLGSCWPETFSFVMYEALAANCTIITHKDSGNIQHEITKKSTKHKNKGIVFDTTEELINDFLEGVVLERANKQFLSNKHFDLQYSKLSMEKL